MAKQEVTFYLSMAPTLNSICTASIRFALYLNFQVSCLLYNWMLFLWIRLTGFEMTAAEDGLFQIFYPMFASVSFLSMWYCLYLPPNALIVNRRVQRYPNCGRKTKRHETRSWLISSREPAWEKWLKSMTAVRHRLRVSLCSWVRFLGELCWSLTCGDQRCGFQTKGRSEVEERSASSHGFRMRRGEIF